MAKNTMKQNGINKDEIFQQVTLNNASTENSENVNKSKIKPINVTENEFIFITPIKKVKMNPYIPSTPKKKKRTLQSSTLPIVGKNLTTIFESM